MSKPSTRPRATADADLIAIDDVARLLGVRASAIRYYENRGLVEAASRRGGRRWFRAADVRRLALVRYWQHVGLLSLEEIGDIVAGANGSRGWRPMMEEHIAELRERAKRTNAARRFLEHILLHHPDAPPDGCEHYESSIFAFAPSDPKRSRRPPGR